MRTIRIQATPATEQVTVAWLAHLVLDIGTGSDGGAIIFDGNLHTGTVVAQRQPGRWTVSFRPNPDGTWTGTDGRSDDTLAQSAATLGPSDLGLTGTDILTQGSLKPGGYVSGYLIWKIPTAPGHITLLSGSADGMSQHPVLQINLGGQ